MQEGGAGSESGDGAQPALHDSFHAGDASESGVEMRGRRALSRAGLTRSCGSS